MEALTHILETTTAAEKLALANKWLRDAEIQDAKAGVVDFARFIDPNYAENYGARHMRVIGAALDKVSTGATTRLFITAPPRHLKSSLVAEKFALKYLADHPDETVGIFSHGASLPLRFSKQVRGNIESNPRFHELYPAIKLKRGSENQSDWAVEGAYRSSFRSFGVGSAPTGEGFGLIIVDDPVADAKEAYNPARLADIWTWYQETLRDRLNPGGKIVLVMSRWHENDLAGRLLRESAADTGERWEQVHLPAICDDEENDLLRRKLGEALWPDKIPLSALEAQRKASGGRAFAARFQGSPKAMDGNILDSVKLKMIDASEVPKLVKIVRCWDLAFSERNGADWVSGVKMGLAEDGRRFILHVKRIQGRWTQSAPVIRDVAHQDEPECVQGIEGNGTQLGYYQEMADDVRMADRMVKLVQPEGNKEMRASMWGTRLDDGIIHCVRAEWNANLFDEMDYFPGASHDDMVDGVSGAWKMLGEADEMITEESLKGTEAGGSIRPWGTTRTWPGRGAR